MSNFPTRISYAEAAAIIAEVVAQHDAPRALDCGDPRPEHEIHPALGVVGVRAYVGPLDVHLAGHELLRERRALIGREELVAEQGDAPGKAQLAQADGGLRPGLPGADDDHVIRHGGCLAWRAMPGKPRRAGRETPNERAVRSDRDRAAPPDRRQEGLAPRAAGRVPNAHRAGQSRPQRFRRDLLGAGRRRGRGHKARKRGSRQVLYRECSDFKKTAGRGNLLTDERQNSGTHGQ